MQKRGAALIAVAVLTMSCGGGGSEGPAPATPSDPPATPGTPSAPEQPGTPQDPGTPQTPGTPITRTVSGTFSTTYHPVSGPAVELRADLTTLVVAAHVPTADGYRVIAGTGDALGTFRVEDVPAGEFVLQLRDRYYATSASDLEAGLDVFGRVSAEEVAPDATITLDLAGLAPAAPGDLVYLYSPDVGNLAVLPELAPGATTVTGSWAFTDLFAWNEAIDGTVGDRLLVLQMEAASDGDFVLTHAMETSAFTLTSGTATLAGTLTLLPMETLEATVLSDAFAMASGPAPAEDLGRVRFGAASSPRLEVNAIPSPFAPGYWTMPVTYASKVAQYGPIDDGTLRYGVLGEGWYQFAVAERQLSIRYRVEPAAQEKTMFYGARVLDAPATFAGRAVGPRISAPRDVRIGESDFGACISGGSATPLLSWSAPELGSTSWYEVWISELYADGLLTMRTPGPRLVTTSTAIRIPEGVLSAGRSYVFELHAVSMPAVDRRTQLRREAFPQAGASRLSGIYAP